MAALDIPSRQMHTFLCVHGIGGTRNDWAGVAGPLERLGRVACVDVPAGSMERGRDAIVDDLERGPGPGILVGHSRGGVLALMVAAERPRPRGAARPHERVRAADARRPFVDRRQGKLGEAPDAAGRPVRPRRAPDRASSRQPAASLRTSFPSVMRIAGLGLRPAAFDRIARAVPCPVLAISGERDSHVPSSWVGGRRPPVRVDARHDSRRQPLCARRRARCVGRARRGLARGMSVLLNDVHSALNASQMARVAEVETRRGRPAGG